MFATIAGAIGPAGLNVALVLIAVFCAAMIIFLRSRNASTPLHQVHKGKSHTGGCKFDANEVRRTRFLKTPAIDLSNLPAPDPRVVKAFATIKEPDIRADLMALSGETPITIAGNSVTIKSRSSFGKGVGLAMTHLEEYYATLGLATKREAYKISGKTYYNLIVTIKGKKNPNMVIVLGAHLDSTAGNTYRDEPVAPGCDDDLSGTVGNKVAARILKDLDLDFTIEICHFTGEEQGLYGSYFHADQIAAAKMDCFMIEQDMIGYCRNDENRVDLHDGADKNGSHSIVVLMVRNIARYNLNLKPVDTHNHAVDDRSDHAGFLDHGYKAILVSEEFTDEGFNPNYHSTTDRIAAVNVPFMIENIKAITATMVDLATESK